MGLRDYVASREPESFNAIEFPPTPVPRNISAHRESDMTSSEHCESDMTSSDDPSLNGIPPSLNTKNTEPLVNGSSSHVNDAPTQVTLPVSDPI